MKILCLLFLFLSCAKETEYKSLIESYRDNEISILEKGQYSKNIETMIFFLWPKNLNYSHQENVTNIIKSSREISLKNKGYIDIFYLLKQNYEKLSCDCQLYYICNENQQSNDVDLLACEDIVKKQDSNKQVLAQITLEHEKIKKELSAIDAINIDIGMDEDIINIGELDFSNNILKVNKLRFKNKDYFLELKLEFYIDKGLKAKFSFDLDGIVFNAQVDVIQKNNSLSLQGDVKTNAGHSGLIYWEHFR